jgi:hypothetical protein
MFDHYNYFLSKSKGKGKGKGGEDSPEVYPRSAEEKQEYDASIMDHLREMMTEAVNTRMGNFRKSLAAAWNDYREDELPEEHQAEPEIRESHVDQLRDMLNHQLDSSLIAYRKFLSMGRAARDLQLGEEEDEIVAPSYTYRPSEQKD